MQVCQLHTLASTSDQVDSSYLAIIYQSQVLVQAHSKIFVNILGSYTPQP